MIEWFHIIALCVAQGGGSRDLGEEEDGLTGRRGIHEGGTRGTIEDN